MCAQTITTSLIFQGVLSPHVRALSNTTHTVVLQARSKFTIHCSSNFPHPLHTQVLWITEIFKPQFQSIFQSIHAWVSPLLWYHIAFTAMWLRFLSTVVVPVTYWPLILKHVLLLLLYIESAYPPFIRLCYLPSYLWFPFNAQNLI